MKQTLRTTEASLHLQLNQLLVEQEGQNFCVVNLDNKKFYQIIIFKSMILLKAIILNFTLWYIHRCYFGCAFTYAQVSLQDNNSQQYIIIHKLSLTLCFTIISKHQGGRGHWAGYLSPNFIIRFFYSLAYQLWGLSLNSDWLVYKVECQNVSTNH